MADEVVYYRGQFWTVVHGVDRTGAMPVSDFLKSLEEDDRQKLEYVIVRHADEQNPLPNRHYKKFAQSRLGAIWEFKVYRLDGGLRVLFVTRSGRRIVMVRGFWKKEDDADPAEVRRAEEVFEAHVQRYPDQNEENLKTRARKR
jgi:hypothetical protein